MAEEPIQDELETRRGPLGWLMRRFRSARAWEEIRARLPERLPLPRRLLVARLAVVCAIIVFSVACVIIVWRLGPLRREAQRQAGHEMIFLQLRAQVSAAALERDPDHLREDAAWLLERVERFAAGRHADAFGSAELSAAIETVLRRRERPIELIDSRTFLGEIDDLIASLRAEEAEIADALDGQFDLLTLLVVGALVLSTVTLLLMERTNRAKEKLAALHYRATHDHLTQGLNRGAILNVAERELARAARVGRSLAVLLVDLDRFKAINDGHGHAAGDAVIRQSARRLRGNVRIYDSVGRYGGDEFLIVLPDADEAEVARIAARLHAAFGRPIDLGPVMKKTSISIGGAVHHGGDEPIDALIARADRALYRAKEAGRDGWAIDADPTAPALPAARKSDESAAAPDTGLESEA